MTNLFVKNHLTEYGSATAPCCPNDQAWDKQTTGNCHAICPASQEKVCNTEKAQCNWLICTYMNTATADGSMIITEKLTNAFINFSREIMLIGIIHGIHCVNNSTAAMLEVNK